MLMQETKNKTLGKRELRKENIRNAILQVTRETFFEKGYQATTLDEIAKKAGVTKRTLYKYFPSKIALCMNVTEDYLQKLNTKISETVSLDLPSDKKLLKLIDDLVDFFKENERFLPRFLTLDLKQFNGVLPQELVDRVLFYSNSMIQDVVKVIEKGQKEGVIINYDPKLLVHLVVAICRGIYSHSNTQALFQVTDIKPDVLFGAFFTILNKDIIRIPRS